MLSSNSTFVKSAVTSYDTRKAAWNLSQSTDDPIEDIFETVRVSKYSRKFCEPQKFSNSTRLDLSKH